MSRIIDRIHEFDRFGSVLGLERMEVLMEKLGNPQDGLRVIHIAGTNGKGSVCKFLEQGLKSCGYRVGLYTSPFIEEFNERIRFDGSNITDEDLDTYSSRAIRASEEIVAEGGDSPTEFEVITAAALLYFAEKHADLAILEVGLGGRGDSTNIVEKPLICAVTSVSYDHMDRLGDTLAEIAGEKAGIIKSGVPVVSNVPDHEAAAVIARKAYRSGSRLYDVSGIRASSEYTEDLVQNVTMEIFGTDYSDVEISMAGAHQCENLKTALAVIEVLRKAREIKVERGALYDGLRKAVQPGRFEVLSEGSPEDSEPAVIIDGAHNAAGAEALRDTVKSCFPDSRILLVTGILADKDADGILSAFADITHDIIVTEPDNPRKLGADRLTEHLRSMGIEPAASADTGSCLETAMKAGKGYDAVLFAGSLYLIGDIRRRFKYEHRKKDKEGTAVL